MTDKPNILWLILDCARYDRLSGHGYPHLTTPVLDELATNGLDYHHALSAAIWSLPSYTSLLTGLYPRYHGINTKGFSLSSNVSTLAQQLQLVGYKTACFSNNAWLEPTFGVGKGFDRFDRLWYSAQETKWDKLAFLTDRLSGMITGNVDKGARRTNRRIGNWLAAHDQAPTFTFVAYVEPHMPYTYHGHMAMWGRQSIMKSIRREAGVKSMEWVQSLPARHTFDSAELEEINYRYDMEMRYIDSMVEVLLTDLKRKGLLENSIVIVTADHGELLGEDGMLGHHFSVAEPLRHVPLIIWAPWKWPKGQHIDDIVQTVDLPATICNWAGAPWESTPGTYLLPEQSGEGERPFAITDYSTPYLTMVKQLYPDKDLSRLEVGLSCISDKKYKLIYDSEGNWRRFALHANSIEAIPTSVADTAEITHLKSELQEYMRQSSGNESVTVEIPNEVTEHLRALGYLD